MHNNKMCNLKNCNWIRDIRIIKYQSTPVPNFYKFLLSITEKITFKD